MAIGKWPVLRAPPAPTTSVQGMTGKPAFQDKVGLGWMLAVDYWTLADNLPFALLPLLSIQASCYYPRGYGGGSLKPLERVNSPGA